MTRSYQGVKEGKGGTDILVAVFSAPGYTGSVPSVRIDK